MRVRLMIGRVSRRYTSLGLARRCALLVVLGYGGSQLCFFLAFGHAPPGEWLWGIPLGGFTWVVAYLGGLRQASRRR
jgi:hypothetical protein